MKTLIQILRESVALDKAEGIALQTHFWQRRRGGESYLNHVHRTYRRAKAIGLDETEQILALLHDCIEDSEYPDKTKETIRKTFKDGQKILEYLDLLTNKPGENYTLHVYDIWKRNKKVFRVKMLDMLDNISDKPTKNSYIKYRETIQFLLKQGVTSIPKQVLKILKIED